MGDTKLENHYKHWFLGIYAAVDVEQKCGSLVDYDKMTEKMIWERWKLPNLTI